MSKYVVIWLSFGYPEAFGGSLENVDKVVACGSNKMQQVALIVAFLCFTRFIVCVYRLNFDGIGRVWYGVVW
jgi:hypothetical protein